MVFAHNARARTWLFTNCIDAGDLRPTDAAEALRVINSCPGDKPMPTNTANLEQRVADLENTLKRLIENLADNNAQFIEPLFALALSENAREKEAAVKKCEGGICPNDPPSCKKKHKDKEDDKD